METITIAPGVNIRADKLALYTYDKLMSSCLNSPEYYQKPNAEKAIHKILIDHGFKKASADRIETKKSDTEPSIEAVKTGDAKKSRRNSKKSKE